MSLVRQAGLKLFFHDALFQSSPEKGEWLCAGRCPCSGISEPRERMGSTSAGWPARSKHCLSSNLPSPALQGLWLCCWTTEPEKNKDPNGKLLGRLKLLLHICPPLEKVLRAEVMKYCQRGKCSLLSKDPRASKWAYMGQQQIAGFEEPNTIFSNYAENTSTTLPKTVSWYLLARNWYRCPASSNFILMWKTKICSDSVWLASQEEVAHEDV